VRRQDLGAQRPTGSRGPFDRKERAVERHPRRAGRALACRGPLPPRAVAEPIARRECADAPALSRLSTPFVDPPRSCPAPTALGCSSRPWRHRARRLAGGAERASRADDWQSRRIATHWAGAIQLTWHPAGPILLRQAMGVAMKRRVLTPSPPQWASRGTQRLWVVSIRGRASSLVPGPPCPAVGLRSAGVRVERYFTRRRGADPLRLRGSSARGPGSRGQLGLRRHLPRGGASGGGLGAGPVMPRTTSPAAERASAKTVIRISTSGTLLHHRGAVTGGNPIRCASSTFRLGERIVLYGGLHWVDGGRAKGHRSPSRRGPRRTETAEVSLGVTHLDGDGWATGSPCPTR
jgi:hypothetical protein